MKAYEIYFRNYELSLAKLKKFFFKTDFTVQYRAPRPATKI